ncbi:hypothetical protein [Frigoribacterium sp. NPDC087798]|uniref:hypothetical protein n=1 Tax=Frigoribacterium sp. NPDC087798 TaxID=3363993 RepID=UPI00382D9972
MATYQVVPYRISVRPTRGTGADTRPLADVDGNKANLLDLIAQTLKKAPLKRGAKAIEYSFAKKEDTTYRLGDLRKGDNVLYSVVTRGSAGIQSKIMANGALAFTRSPDHIEDIDFRTMFVFPKGGKYAIMLTERIGTGGVSSFIAKLLTDTLKNALPKAMIDIKPLTTVADIANTNVMLNSIEYQFLRPTDPSGKFMDTNGADGVLSMKYKFGAKRRLDNYAGSSGLDASKIFGVIDPGLSQHGINLTGDKMKNLKAQANLNVTLPSGNTRTFTLGIDEGPGLLYALEAKLAPATGGGQKSAAALYRPSDVDFVRVCKEAIEDVKGSFGVLDTTSASCVKPSATGSVKVPASWKVVWNVTDNPAPNSP